MGNCLSQCHHPVRSNRVHPAATGTSQSVADNGHSTFLDVPRSQTHKGAGGCPTHNQSQCTNLENEAFKAMITRHNELVLAVVAGGHLKIAGLLLGRGFISEETHAKMHLPLTPNEKASLLVIAVRDKIKLAPQMFQELMKLLSENDSTKDVVNSLWSAKQGEKHVNINQWKYDCA